jgi:hypothetical protein
MAMSQRRNKMHLLPSEKKERIDKAIRVFNETNSLNIFEPCDCGSQIRHNNGGNYHETIHLQRDGQEVFVKYDTSCELVPEAEWQLVDDWKTVIEQNADWL